MRLKIMELLLTAAMIAAGFCLWSCESRPRQEIYTGPVATETTPAGPATGTNPETPGSDSDINGTAPGGNNSADNADNQGSVNNGSSGNPAENNDTPEPDNGTEASNTPETDNGAPQPDGTTQEDPAPARTDNPAPNGNSGETENPPTNGNNTANHTDAGTPNNGNNGNTTEPTDAGTPNNEENPADAGTTADASNPPTPPVAPPVLETPTDGVLVTAQENSGGSALQQTPETHADAPAEVIANPEGLATYTSADGNIYHVRAFSKDENETLAEWNIRSYYGDSSSPMETTLTANNYPVAMYATDDEGILPVIHALIATGRFVYRIDWRDPVIPNDAASAVEFIRNNRERYFAVPEHFKVFVRGIAVR